MPLRSRKPTHARTAFPILIALAAVLFAPAMAIGDTGPFPACADGSTTFFCVGDIDFTSLVVATEPAHATSDQKVALRVSALESVAGSPCHGDFLWSRRPTIVDRKILFELRMADANCPTPPPDPRPKQRVTRTWDLGALPQGIYTVQFRWENVIDWAEARVEVHAPTSLLSLHDGLFVVYANRALPGGGSAAAAAVPLTDQSGYFTFYDPGNVELTIKILDGRAINGHYWVFVASMTDRPFVLTVVQKFPTSCGTLLRHNCPSRTYTATLGNNRNFIDVEFPAAPPP